MSNGIEFKKVSKSFKTSTGLVRPKYLLLDEPFSGLDLTIKLSLFEEIRELAEKINMDVILVTHDPLEARSLCQNAIVLEEGQLVCHMVNASPG